MFYRPSKKSIFLSFLVLFLGMIAQPVFAKEDIRYTRYNVHTQSKDGKLYKASYANYTSPGAGHFIIPAGTQITITDKSNKRFVFVFENDKRVIYEFHKSRMGMSLDEYIDKITTLPPVSFETLSELDRKGIADGKVYLWMTRDGVLAALGYPATHRTPSLENSTWVYWKNRFTTIVVEFDDQGKVVVIHG